jgi:hypothetical protein
VEGADECWEGREAHVELFYVKMANVDLEQRLLCDDPEMMLRGGGELPRHPGALTFADGVMILARHQHRLLFKVMLIVTSDPSFVSTRKPIFNCRVKVEVGPGDLRP